MLKAKNGATMETDLEETPSGWVARYLIVSAELGKFKPQRQVFPSKADAVAVRERPRLCRHVTTRPDPIVGSARSPALSRRLGTLENPQSRSYLNIRRRSPVASHA